MFISYIIPPFQSEVYLVRCIESLYGQTADDFEVIVAESSFSTCEDYISNALETKKNFRIIEECRPEEKLAAAVRMISGDAEFVQFVETSTVVVPHALETIRSAAGDAQLLMPASILRRSDGFERRFPHGWDGGSDMGAMNAFDYCFRKALFERYEDKITENLYDVETLIDMLIGSGISFVFVEDVCCYMTKSSFEIPKIAVNDYDMLRVISAGIAKEELGSAKVKLFTKYVHRLTAVIDSQSAEFTEKQNAYELLKQFGEDSAENTALSKIFVLNTGIPVSDMKRLDIEGYRTLRNEQFRLADTETSVGLVSDLLDKYNIRRNEDTVRMERWIKNYDNERKAMQAENQKMHNDIAALTANMHLLMERIEQGGIGKAASSNVSSFTNPIEEVPFLFATGKLGMKAIFKCISGWFRFKFSKKK